MIELNIQIKFNVLAKMFVFHWILNIVNSKYPFFRVFNKVVCKKKPHFKSDGKCFLFFIYSK